LTGNTATPTRATTTATTTNSTNNHNNRNNRNNHSRTNSGKKDLLRRKKLQQQMRMAVRSSPISKQTSNPLRAELMKLISALHRHGVITSEVRGSLKDELIGAKTMVQLRALHEKISFDVGNQVAPVAPVAPESAKLPIPDVHELLERGGGKGKR
jgi:hypothetical protein